MSKISIHLISDWSHCSQILTGFLILKEKDILDLKVYEDKEVRSRIHNLAAVLVVYKGKRIVYDLQDGYINFEEMRYLIDTSDYFFKRSFSQNCNSHFFSIAQNQKIYPLGMNYSVYCKNNPYVFLNGGIKNLLRPFRGGKPNCYFTPQLFESVPSNNSKDKKILFLSRLWNSSNESVQELNMKRISIIRSLKHEFGNLFLGGLQESELSKKYAPDIVVSKKYTEKSRYIKLMKEADICINTLGLHHSTGWKTAEYIAASKGIVNEELVYSNLGKFIDGENYLSFHNENECCKQVERLISDPNCLYAMQKANYRYYNEYLRPDKLILNTLKVVDS